MTDPNVPQSPTPGADDPIAPPAPSDGSGASGELSAASDAPRLATEVLRLRTRLEEAEQSRREHDDYISIMAHDLRTPLTSIRGYAQLMLRQARPRNDEPPDPRAESLRNGLQTIIEQADRLATLTATLLDVARVRTGRVALHLAEVDLGQLTRDVAAQANTQARIQSNAPAATRPGAQPQPDASANGVTAAAEVAPGAASEVRVQVPDKGPVVLADGARLKQVLDTLLDFARQHTTTGQPIELRVAQPSSAAGTPGTSAIGTSAAGDIADAEVEVRLALPGEPLTPTDQARLFDQLVIETTTSSGGLERQMGHPELYIVRGLVEAHGGSLCIEGPATAPNETSGTNETNGALAAEPRQWITLRLPVANATDPSPDSYSLSS